MYLFCPCLRWSVHFFQLASQFCWFLPPSPPHYNVTKNRVLLCKRDFCDIVMGGKGGAQIGEIARQASFKLFIFGGPDVDLPGQIYEENCKKCTDHLRHGHQLLIKKKSHFLNLTQDPSLNFSETRRHLVRIFGKSGFLSISLLFFLPRRRALARNALSEPELRGINHVSPSKFGFS